MKYIKQVDTETEAVASKDFGILYYVLSNGEVIFKTNETYIYIYFSANGSGILLVNEGYINGEGMKVNMGSGQPIVLSRNTSEDKTIGETNYYAYHSNQLCSVYGEFFTTIDLSTYSKDDKVIITAYIYNDSEMIAAFSDIEVTITKYDASYTGPVEQLIEYEAGDNQKVKVNSFTIVCLSDRLGPDGTPANTTLTEITIPATVTYYGEKTFRSSSALETVIFEEGTTTIYEEGFRDCGAITTVTIPGSVTSIGDEAFDYCRSLNTVIYNGTSYTVKAELLSALAAANVTVGDGAFDNTDLEEPTDTTTIVE